MAEKVIAFIGDSILNGYWDQPFQGWGLRLVGKFGQDRPYAVGAINTAISGHRVFDALYQLCGPVISCRPDCVIISIGANDIQRSVGPGQEILMSRDLREEIWTKLLDLATKNIPQVFVTSVQPVDDSKMPFVYDGVPQCWFMNKDIDAYNKDIQNYCRQYDVEYLDFNGAVDRQKWPGMLHDGLHPNPAGHEFLAELAYGFLKGKI
jgi:lysophospholipase L1-like esterase